MTQHHDPRHDPGVVLGLDGGLTALINDLRLLYQPLVDLNVMTIAGVEVLVRVQAPDGRLGGAEPVLAAMDGAAASMTITREILRRGMHEQAVHRLGDQSGLSFIFNLPLDTMLHPRLTDMIEEVRGDHLPAGRLGFELTERHPVENVEQLSLIIDRLTAAGYKVALDDITPDTPHLSELMKLPFQTVKLDRGVVISKTDETASYIRKVVADATARRQNVVAEGIETTEVLRRMRDLDVSHGQGYLFARPMPAAALPAFLADFAARSVKIVADLDPAAT